MEGSKRTRGGAWPARALFRGRSRPVFLAVICLGMATGLLAASIPGRKVLKDVPYIEGGNPRQTLDIYLPDTPSKQPLPLVVWIHGGSWLSGDKTDTNLAYLVGDRYVLASIGYRFSTEAAFPAQIQDCNAALDFLVAHASEYAFDPRKIVVSGGSAGGHLALLLGLARGEKDFHADAAVKPAGILDFFAPADLNAIRCQVSADRVPWVDDVSLKLLGKPLADHPELGAAASPVSYVGRGNPPVLILHGTGDEIVPVVQSRNLRKKLEAAGVSCDLVELAGVGHGGEAFSTPPSQAKVRAFLSRVCGGP